MLTRTCVCVHRPFGQLVAEPAKNATSCGLRLRYTDQHGEDVGGQQPGASTRGAGEAKGQVAERTVALFVKFQCGRGLLLWLQALRSVMELGVAREVLFYQLLARRVPMRVARPLFAGAVHWCNRVCIVLEHLGSDARVVRVPWPSLFVSCSSFSLSFFSWEWIHVCMETERLFVARIG
jgi:hypothetical protein